MEENINMILAISDYQLTTDEAKQLLANHGNNLEAAIGNYLDSSLDILKSHLRNSQAKWDESAFGGAAYGAEDATLPTFNIDYAPGLENYPHSAGNSRAPTRPPSRASNRSAASTQAHAGDAPIQSIENQESGVIGNPNATFGPATRETYETSQWALVPTATEVIADPIPSQRKREEGQPAMIKPSSGFNFLPALLPILHSIPLFRNALLCPGVLQKDYWAGDDWWKGIASQNARIISDSMGLSEANGLEIIYEAQRFMAFLDNTDRVYGSVNAMLDSDAWKESQASLEDPDDDLLKFLLVWGFAFQSNVPDGDLNGVLRSTVNIGGAKQESFVLDTDVVRGQGKSDVSLYDVLDDALFSSATTSAHIVDASKVLILRLTSSNTTAADLGCRIPATLYIDRYLQENKPVIDSMYNDMKHHEEQLGRIQAQIVGLKYHTPQKAGAKKVDSLQLLRTSMTAYEPTSSDATPDDAAVLSQLQQLYENIENKLKTLDEQTHEVQRTITSISSRFKPRVDDGADISADNAMDTTENIEEKSTESAVNVDYPEGQSPDDAMKHPYYLHGVATRRDVVYMLHPDIKSNDPGAKQWWRMQYDTESSNPTIRRDRLSLQEVIERATTESASALLVYANEEAVSYEPTPLAKPLEDFVKRDNLNFLEELQKTATGWENYGDDYGNVAQGGWDTNPPDYDNGWNQGDNGWSQISAKEFHSSRDRNDSNMSSTTLTPNTEIDDDGPVAQEMVEANRGASALAGMSSASSETVGRDADGMDLDAVKSQSKVSFSDVDMLDTQQEPRTQHIEIAEKKGG